MINTSECEECLYGTLHEKSKAIIKVYCSIKDKEYYFGQCISCENKKKIKTDLPGINCNEMVTDKRTILKGEEYA